MTRVVYLHGFASGPGSAKGRFFKQKFGELGVETVLPDLAEGCFSGLTISGQLRVVDRAVRQAAPCLLMGSSLGGYLAALYGARYPEAVPGLALLAPAFGFPARWAERLGEEKMAEWRETGSLEVYHYGEKAVRPVGYEFYRDALWFDEFPAVTQPVLAFHGRYDEEVPAALLAQFAAGRPNVQLRLVDSDHKLLDVLEPMWREICEFWRALETRQPRRA